jgi:sphinganine-1-phosphate aldolase
MSPKKLPPAGMSKEKVLSLLRARRSDDSDWHQGRLFGLIYYAGKDVEQMAGAAYSEYLFENALSPFDFPSLLTMETEFVSMIGSIFGGDGETAGAMTSGGTESILMAVKAARDWARINRPAIQAPEIVAPLTAHPAFNKAAHYLGLKIVPTEIDRTFRADVTAIEKAVTKNTVMVAATAVTYPHGVIDPIEQIGRVALKRHLWFHVDACLGGYVLPFLKKLGQDIPPFDFSVPGVTSLSADIHKYGYVSKGVSSVLYRNREFRRSQFFVYTDWPGGVYATPSLSGARPGGAIASAWAMLHYLGEEGFMRLAGEARKAAVGLLEGIRKIPGLFVFGDPPATVLAFGSESVNVYQLGAKLKERGWHLHAQHRPAGLHMTISPVHEKIVMPFLNDLKQATEELAGTSSPPAGEAALYGAMGTMPDREMAKRLALQYLDGLYQPKEDPGAAP